MTLWRILPVATLCGLVSGCDSMTNEGMGLRPGAYSVAFTILASGNTPSELAGDHQFTFRVGDPTDDSTFRLLSSQLNGDAGADYLDPSSEEVIGGTSEWRLQWRYADAPTFGVRVTMVDDGDGGFVLPSGCRGLRDRNSFQGFACSVVRTGS